MILEMSMPTRRTERMFQGGDYGPRLNATDRAARHLKQGPAPAGPLDCPDPAGAMPNQKDLRDLEALLRPAISSLLRARQSDIQARLAVVCSISSAHTDSQRQNQHNPGFAR